MYLLIDASTKSIGVSIVDDEKVYSDISMESGLTHSVDLLPSINFSLNSIGIRLSELSGIIACHGPGSFTGLRIAMSTIKALAHPLNIPLYTASTLRTLSFHGRNFDGIICPIMDARRKRVYVSAYDGYLGEELLEEQTMEIQDLLAFLTPYNKKVLFVGDGISVYKDDIKAADNSNFVVGDMDTRLSKSLGLYYLYKNNMTETCSYEDVSVNYVRKPQAEREREENASKTNGN